MSSLFCYTCEREGVDYEIDKGLRVCEFCKESTVVSTEEASKMIIDILKKDDEEELFISDYVDEECKQEELDFDD
jgi:hypothetical protein